MDYKEYHTDLDLLRKSRRRMLNCGPPDSGKTGATYTLPGHVQLISFPGEEGTASIPLKNFQGIPVKAYVPPDIDVSKPQNYAEIVDSTYNHIMAVIAGKHGKCDVLVLDGLHKYYHFLLATRCGGANLRGEDFKDKDGKDAMGRAYGQAHRKLYDTLGMVNGSSCPWVVVTAWVGLDKDDPEDKRRDASKHIMPALPGQAAEYVLGSFSIKMYSYVEGYGKDRKFMWQTRPGGKIWSAGIKQPVDLMRTIKIDREVKQDYYAYDKYLDEQVTREWNKLHKEAS